MQNIRNLSLPRHTTDVYYIETKISNIQFMIYNMSVTKISKSGKHVNKQNNFRFSLTTKK